MEQTTNYGLNKPGGSDYARIDVLNANMDAVDAALKDLEESKAEGAALAAHEADGVKHVSAAERETLTQGFALLSDEVDTHIARTDNPHGVTAAQVGAAPTTRKVNGKALSADITLTAGDVKAIPFDDSRADIPEGADLNSYTAVGVYRCKNNATAGSLTNSPTTDAFIMDILPSTGTSIALDGNYAYLIQKIMTNGNRYYARKLSTNGDVSTPVYDAWIEFYTTRSKPAPADIGAAVKYRYTATIPTGTWTAVSGGGYYKDITVSGITAAMTPCVGVVQTSDAAASELMVEEFANNIRRIETMAGKIRVYTRSDGAAPSVNIPIQLVGTV